MTAVVILSLVLLGSVYFVAREELFGGKQPRIKPGLIQVQGTPAVEERTGGSVWIRMKSSPFSPAMLEEIKRIKKILKGAGYAYVECAGQQDLIFIHKEGEGSKAAVPLRFVRFDYIDRSRRSTFNRFDGVKIEQYDIPILFLKEWTSGDFVKMSRGKKKNLRDILINKKVMMSKSILPS